MSIKNGGSRSRAGDAKHSRLGVARCVLPAEEQVALLREAEQWRLKHLLN